MSARRVLAVALVVVAGAGGCAVGPNYVRPTATTPDAYKEVAGWVHAQPRDDLPHGAWWDVFADRDLSALVAQLDVSSQTLLAAEAQVRQARALVREARASYFPQVTIGAGIARSHAAENVTSSSTGSVIVRPGTTSTFTLPLDVSWEPDLWGRVRRSVESNQAAAQASVADLESVRLSVQAEIAQDYFLLRALDAETALLARTIEADTRALTLTQSREAVGVASRVDVAQAETQLRAVQAQQVDLGVQRAQLEHAIAILIGRAPSDLSLAPAPLAAEPPAIPVGVPSALLQRRPDVAAAERRVAAANAQIGVATAAFFPTVTLSASAGFQSSGISSWLTAPSHFWSVGASVSETVIDGGFRGAQRDQVRAAYDATVAMYRQTVLTGFQEVEDNLAALGLLEREAAIQNDAVAAAQEALALTLSQYQAGTVSYLNVVVAQTTALTNEFTAEVIRGRRMVASALLVKALGGGWSAAGLPSAREVTRRCADSC